MSRFANLADKQSVSKVEGNQVGDAIDSLNATFPPSRPGIRLLSLIPILRPQPASGLHGARVIRPR